MGTLFNHLFLAFQLWIEKPVQNRSIFTKIEETGPDRFHQFLVNRLVKFELFKILRNF
jgi:hypothetical protein